MESNEAWANAMREVDSSDREPGLWAKCFAEADGDEAKAKAAYIRQRVSSPDLPQQPVPAVVQPELKDMGYCPNCGVQCAKDAAKCPRCHAVFDANGWQPRNEKPAGAWSEEMAARKQRDAHETKQVSPATEAASKQPGGSIWKWIVGVPVGAFVLVMIIGSCAGNDPAIQAANSDKRAIERCWAEQSRKSLDPATARFAAGACELMESNFRQKHGRNP